MAAHTLVYYGFYDASFHKLVPGQARAWTKDGAESAVELPPPDKFDGIKFGFMQRSEGFVIVQVDNLVLRAPVLFVGGRHGPKGPGPQWSNLDDDVATRILVDVIVANAELRDVLGDKIRALDSVSQRALPVGIASEPLHRIPSSAPTLSRPP